MRTIKLVVIGASGVGKTSLRGQYISGRFSNGYRATIGADFITKTLQDPSNPGEAITLQIWDTAGQERFSSLSTAFFRGADAAILMFDVNTPETMEALTKWWGEFRERAPVADEDLDDYCCVVVGNKTDLVVEGADVVTESEALSFLEDLVPSSIHSPTPNSPPSIEWMPSSRQDQRRSDTDLNVASSSNLSSHPPIHTPREHEPPSHSLEGAEATNSIAIHPSSASSFSPRHRLTKSRSSNFYGGTMTTTHTTLSIYHTPSSSLFDTLHSARSSPEPWSPPSTSTKNTSNRIRRMTTLSTESTSTGSAVTMTPSLFARENNSEPPSETTTPDNNDDDDPFKSSLPPPPARGPKLFFTSAKTGEGVKEVFEYVAKRVVRRWEYEERLEARRMHVRDTSAAETIQLGLSGGRKWQSERVGWSGCCAS